MVNKDSHIVDGRMVVVERGKCPTPCKKGGALSGRRQCPGNMSRGNVQIPPETYGIKNKTRCATRW